MVKLTYAEQLRHPNWQRKRLEILQRDEFACRVCYDTQSTLHVHHKHYVKGRMAWEYPEEELVTLCESCHDEAHEKSEEAKSMLAKLPLDGPASLSDVMGLIGGFTSGEQGLDFPKMYEDEPHHFLVGYVANRLMWAIRTPELADLGNALSAAPAWVVRAGALELVDYLRTHKDDAEPAGEKRGMDGL